MIAKTYEDFTEITEFPLGINLRCSMSSGHSFDGFKFSYSLVSIFYASYGVKNQPGREKLMHELLDLEYLIVALVVGGLASREKRMIERFKLLRSDGILLR